MRIRMLVPRGREEVEVNQLDRDCKVNFAWLCCAGPLTHLALTQVLENRSQINTTTTGEGSASATPAMPSPIVNHPVRFASLASYSSVTVTMLPLT